MIEDAVLIAERIGQLMKVLKEPLDRSDVRRLMDELDFRQQWLIESAEMVAQTQFILDEASEKAKNELLKDTVDVPATQFKVALAAATKHERRLSKLAEQLHADLGKQIGGIITLLSTEKQLMMIR
jgi:hypothetical protein